MMSVARFSIHRRHRWQSIALRGGGGAALIAFSTVSACTLDPSGLAPMPSTTATALGGSGGAGGSGGTAGSGAAPECTLPSDCTEPDTDCQNPTCDQGICGLAYEPVATPCDDDGGEVCNGAGSCLLDLGSACGNDPECVSGICHDADGVCCDTLCDGTCVSCVVAGGTCVPISAATDPDGECAGGVCDGSGACAIGDTLFSDSYGTQQEQRAWAIGVDGNGNVTVVGDFLGTANFGGANLVSAGGWDIFVAKFDAGGNHLWSQRFGGVGAQRAYMADVDAAGNIVITGPFLSTFDFGGPPLTSTGSWDMYVAVLDTNGNHVWSRSFGDAQEQYGAAVAFDGGGNVIATGFAQGTINFGGSNLPGALTRTDVVVAKFDSLGNHLWSKRFGGGAADEEAWAVAVDSQDNVVVAGNFNGTFNFGGSDLVSAGGWDVFLAKLDSSGNHLWSQGFGDAADEASGWSVAIDGSNDIHFVGHYQGLIDFGGGNLPDATTSYNVFLARFDAAGAYKASAGFGSPGEDQWGRSVAVDSSGNPVVIGTFLGTINLGGSDLTASNGRNVYTAKFAGSDGTHLWSHGYGDDQIQAGTALDIAPSDEILLTGYFRGTIDFGAGLLTAIDEDDVFVARLSP